MKHIMEIRQWRIDEYCAYVGYNAKEDDVFTEEEIDFYLRCKNAGLHYADADRYAILNTLFGYDIGMENARKIDGWMYENDEEVYELTYKDVKLLSVCCKKLGIKLNFEKFRKDEFDTYEYFPSKPDIVQYSFDFLDDNLPDIEEIVNILEENGINVIGSMFQERWKSDEYC